VSETWDGLLPIDKPAGPTSHDIVAWVRDATGARRVGHTGTLDPPATGLLLLVLGRATRLARFVPDAPKTYRGVLALGVTTSTDDLAGEVIARYDGPLPDLPVLRCEAARRLGPQLQTPPAYSARSVGGTRLYRAARRGVVLEAPATPILVERLLLEETETAGRFAYEMVVSSGTYVRAIVRDLGAALGCGAAVASLRRTGIGPMCVDDALQVPPARAGRLELARRHLIPLDAMPLALPTLTLETASDVARFAGGAATTLLSAGSAPVGLVAVRDAGGRLLGVGASAEGTLKPQVVIP
jgi:tRNA pseudouridine55 synthase